MEENTMKKTTAPISLAGSQLGEVRHVCAFFNSDEEEYRVLLPFIKDGFESGDKAVHVVNPDQRHDHLQRLAAVRIDPAFAEQSGELELRINTEAYLLDGRFDQDRMLAAFEQMAFGNAKGGFPLSRIAAGWIGQLKIDPTLTISLNSNRAWMMCGVVTTTR
jgi:MEDS: MEthanogen/methylotroph, DcmR Sensory domain